MMDLMVSSDGDIPTFMRIGNGNESDKTIFPLFILSYKKKFDIDTIYVADSAFYSAKNIHTLKALFWISLVPMTIKKAQEIVRKTGEWVISEISG